MISKTSEESAVGPFDITKAVDFTDEEIKKTWVDLPHVRFESLVNPRSPIPQLILGGKGSGRTHLMRYYSYELQKLRAKGADITRQLVDDEYIGIFMRCEGLNAGRFSGKGQDDETWGDIFAYYLDLWLAELVILTFRDALGGTQALENAEAVIARYITELFDDLDPLDSPNDLDTTLLMLGTLRRGVDAAVNNAALTRDVSDVRVRAARSRLVFGVPRAFITGISSIRKLQVTYFIDEFENLGKIQQRYVNTLIRERQRPCSFKVGARLYGVRTRRTLSAGEENRLNSEFEQVILDDRLRERKADYAVFARRLVQRRLELAGFDVPRQGTAFSKYIASQFAVYGDSKLGNVETAFISSESQERPHVVRLRRQLHSAMSNPALGIQSESKLSDIITCVSCRDFPLIEKANILLLYQDWNDKRNLVAAAAKIKQSCNALISGSGGQRHKRILGHFKGDLLAQLLRDYEEPQRYAGFDDFVRMSSAIPRHLLVVLKFVYGWALFNGEVPFRGKQISLAAQRSGVLEAANWFYEDARTVGEDAHAVQTAIERLARFLRELRFSDKPVESSLSSFSLMPSTASSRARETLKAATDVSLLVRFIKGQKDRNDTGIADKFQLNPMICPRFGLPIARRGVTPLSSAEVEAIFGDCTNEDFEKVLSIRRSRMNAPFQEGRSSRKGGTSHQTELPGLS